MCLDFSLPILSRAKKLSWYLCTKSKEQHGRKWLFKRFFARNNLLCNFYLYLDDIVAQLGMKFTSPFCSFCIFCIGVCAYLIPDFWRQKNIHFIHFLHLEKKGFPFSSLLTYLWCICSHVFYLYFEEVYFSSDIQTSIIPLIFITDKNLSNLLYHMALMS